MMSIQVREAPLSQRRGRSVPPAPAALRQAPNDKDDRAGQGESTPAAAVAPRPSRRAASVPKRLVTTTTPPPPTAATAAAPREPQVFCQGTVPILFSAPHGLQIFRRGAPGSAERTRIHKRERWTSEIALRLAAAVGSAVESALLESLGSAKKVGGGAAATAGFLVWNCATAKPLSRELMDPNYLFQSQFGSSPWHTALESFRAAHAASPLHLGAGVIPLHIDLHGKYNRPGDFNIDVGVESMRCCFPGPASLTQQLEKSLQRRLTDALRAAGSGCKHPKLGVPPTIDMDPDLHGLWGTDTATDPHTMTTQAVLLGIPSLQLELPNAFRQALMEDEGLFKAFAVALAQVFLDIQPTSTATAALAEHLGQPESTRAAAANRVVVQTMLADCKRVYVSTTDSQI